MIDSKCWVGIALLAFALAACTNEVNLLPECCSQCTAAASQDPAGMDISDKNCRGYDERLSKQCREFFEEMPRRVEECRMME